MAQAHNLVWNDTKKKWCEQLGDANGVPYMKLGGDDPSLEGTAGTVEAISVSDGGRTLTTTALGANAVYTQAAQDRLAGPAPVGMVGGLAFADKAGTLVIEECEAADFASPTALSTTSVSANTTTVIAFVAVAKRYYRFKYTNGAAAQASFVLVQQVRGLGVTSVAAEISESIPAGTNNIGSVGIDQTTPGTTNKVVAELSGSNAEKESAQDTQLATTAKTYPKANGASRIEVYCESGYIRVRTDGQPCTSTTGEPIATGFAAAWNAESISVFYVQESIITVVSR